MLAIKNALIIRNYTGILLNKGIDWCFPNSDFVNNLTQKTEKEWGTNKLAGTINNQWTTKVGELMVYDVLNLLNKNPRRAHRQEKSSNGMKLCPDWETDDALYECKTRMYKTTGTAGEKILGTPWKYMECFNLYNKPLYIVCVAYQEQEADTKFDLFSPKCEIKRKLLDFYKENGKIQYVKFTDLLLQLL